MASNTKSNIAEAVPKYLLTDQTPEKEPAKVKAPERESVYTAAELADNHKAFGTYREIVVVALRQAKKDRATFSEAKRIIENFKNKEVK